MNRIVLGFVKLENGDCAPWDLWLASPKPLDNPHNLHKIVWGLPGHSLCYLLVPSILLGFQGLSVLDSVGLWGFRVLGVFPGTLRR